jgi:uncharacterized protein
MIGGSSVKSPDLVAYHANCYDGFTAAWVVFREHPSAQFVAAKYGDAPPECADGSSVYVLDFSYPRNILMDWQRRCDVRVLDHHKTAQEDLADLPGAMFDLSKSGAMLAWEHFRPDTAPPPLVRYVEDRDLWRFELEESRAISVWLRQYPFEFKAWETAHTRLCEEFDTCVLEGRTIERFQAQQVEIMVTNAWWTELGEHHVPVTNATVFFSEVGEALCLKYPEAPFALYYLDRADGKRQWGLRSRGQFDCSAVARQFGGGGHTGAAGFVTEQWRRPMRVEA